MIKTIEYIKKTTRILSENGFNFLFVKILQKITNILIDRDIKNNHKLNSHKKKFHSIVYREDIMLADWENQSNKNYSNTKKSTKVINWIISPPSQGGGHQNMFRFIEYLDKKGYENNIYIYSALDKMTINQAKYNVRKYANLEKANFHYYKRNEEMKDSDAIFATGWETCYPVYNEKTNAKKFYFIQDYEPFFYPVGTEYILAENTYKFGFYGITAGKWLSNKLRSEYGMKCQSYNFGADQNIYKNLNKNPRKEVFFYARPSTERRAFDLGIMALEIFNKKHPEYTINLAGWDVSGYEIPFPYINHKTLNLEELNSIYNKCAVGLVISLTNMSLLPLELISSGVIPIVNRGENNYAVSSNKYIYYTEPSPASLSRAMSEIVTKKDLVNYSIDASNSIGKDIWIKSQKKFLSIIEKELYA